MKITIEETVKAQTLDKLMTPRGDIKPGVIDQIERAIHQYLNMVEGNTVVDYDSNSNVKVTVQTD